MMENHHRRFTDRKDVRVLVGTLIVSTFLVLGSIAFAAAKIDSNIHTVENGVTCILGNLVGSDDIQRPDPEDVIEACAHFERGRDERS